MLTCVALLSPTRSRATRCGTVCSAVIFFFFSSRRRHTRCSRDWSSDVCSSDLTRSPQPASRLPLPTSFDQRCVPRDSSSLTFAGTEVQKPDRLQVGERNRPSTVSRRLHQHGALNRCCCSVATVRTRPSPALHRPHTGAGGGRPRALPL